jgi:hypothetical protein
MQFSSYWRNVISLIIFLPRNCHFLPWCCLKKYQACRANKINISNAAMASELYICCTLVSLTFQGSFSWAIWLGTRKVTIKSSHRILALYLCFQVHTNYGTSDNITLRTANMSSQTLDMELACYIPKIKASNANTNGHRVEAIKFVYEVTTFP